MGQKINPVGFRLGVIRSWDSKWYEEKNYAKWLHEDIRLREYVKKKLGQAGISRIIQELRSLLQRDFGYFPAFQKAKEIFLAQSMSLHGQEHGLRPQIARLTGMK